MTIGDSRQIIFFDGVCNLCNSSIDFIISRDVREDFFYASLQGETASRNLSKKFTTELPSIVLVSGGKEFTESEAIGRILLRLPDGWPLLGRAILLFPRFLSNFVYRLVARYRYRWFGKKDACRVPNPEEKRRFLE